VMLQRIGKMSWRRRKSQGNG